MSGIKNEIKASEHPKAHALAQQLALGEPATAIDMPRRRSENGSASGDESKTDLLNGPNVPLPQREEAPKPKRGPRLVKSKQRYEDRCSFQSISTALLVAATCCACESNECIIDVHAGISCRLLGSAAGMSTLHRANLGPPAACS